MEIITNVITLVAKVRTLVWIIEFFPSKLNSIKAETPQTLKDKYWREKLKKIVYKLELKEIDEKISDQSMSDSPLKEKCTAYALLFSVRADIAWGSNNLKNKYKAGWFYVTSAALYASAENFNCAAQNYHFAANQFREIGALRASMQYYLYSAWCYYSLPQNSDHNNTPKNLTNIERSLKRALGVARQSGEIKLEKALEDILEKIEEIYLNKAEKLNAVCSWFDRSRENEPKRPRVKAQDQV